MNLERLKDPFPPTDVEWRIAEAGETKGGEVWAKCLAYPTARTIQDRLDEIVGPANWQNEYRPGPCGGVICGISINIDGMWVTKWDGAENTEFEAIKGGLSDSFKRAAVHWQLGRYLYRLEMGWAEIADDNDKEARYGKTKSGRAFRWYPPRLPDWALPDEYKKKPAATTAPPAAAPPTNGKSATPAAKERIFVPDEPPKVSVIPGDEVALFAIAMSHIRGAMTESELNRCAKRVKDYAKQKTLSPDEVDRLEAAVANRRKTLEKTTAAAN